MGSGPTYGSAPAGFEGMPAGQRHTGRQIFGLVKTWKDLARLEQATEDVVAAGRPGGHLVACQGGRGLGHRATRIPRGVQNPNRAKTDRCDERVCDYAKNRVRHMRAAGVCGTGRLCIRLARVWLVLA